MVSGRTTRVVLTAWSSRVNSEPTRRRGFVGGGPEVSGGVQLLCGPAPGARTHGQGRGGRRRARARACEFDSGMVSELGVLLAGDVHRDTMTATDDEDSRVVKDPAKAGPGLKRDLGQAPGRQEDEMYGLAAVSRCAARMAGSQRGRGGLRDVALVVKAVARQSEKQRAGAR